MTLLEHLTLTPDGHAWLGSSPDGSEGVLFGGHVISQAVMAATRGAPEGRRLHSMHAYFLRPVLADAPVRYEIEVLRDGRSFSSRRLHATQTGKAVLDVTCSFTTDTDGYVYDLGGVDDVPLPDTVGIEPAQPGWVVAWIGASDPMADGTRTSTHRKWCRVDVPLPDDEHLHAALLGFVSDWTGTGGRPLHLDGDITGMVSLDHSVWFHRPARADAWHLYDVQSLVNVGGRGLLRGVLRDIDGRVVMSVAQEMRLTPVSET